MKQPEIMYTATKLTIIHSGARVNVFFDREILKEEFKIMKIIKQLTGI